MTILSALSSRYHAQVSRGEAAPIGFGPALIAFCLVLDDKGGLVGVEDLRRTDAKASRTVATLVPEAPRRTSGVASGTFWDKTSYVLGRTAKASKTGRVGEPSRVEREHAAFLARHETLLAGHDDPGFASLLAFLRVWRPQDYDRLPHAEEMLGLNVCFRLEGDSEFLHDRPASRSIVATETDKSSDRESNQCLVTGAHAPTARVHPAIRGIPGSLPTGAALVSFNLDSGLSYGKSQGANAPISEAAVRAYSAALNELLWSAREAPSGQRVWRNRVQIGDMTLLFWAEAASSGDEDESEGLMGALLDPFIQAPYPETRQTTRLRQWLTAIRAGRPAVDAVPTPSTATHFYILGLSPNMARLSVRLWCEDSLGALLERFREYWTDLRLDPSPWEEAPSVGQLLFELTPQRRYEDFPARLAADVLQSILTGRPFPRALLATAIGRIRAERRTTALRTALIKACLARDARKGLAAEGAPVSLDPHVANKGYRLGRLFAVIDAAQRAGVGRVSARVRDKFFGAASATPARVFPYLLRGSQVHLAAARQRGRRDRADVLDQEIGDILGGLSADNPFPNALSLADQGRFVVGFYHENAKVWARSEPTEE